MTTITCIESELGRRDLSGKWFCVNTTQQFSKYILRPREDELQFLKLLLVHEVASSFATYHRTTLVE